MAFEDATQAATQLKDMLESADFSEDQVAVLTGLILGLTFGLNDLDRLLQTLGKALQEQGVLDVEKIPCTCGECGPPYAPGVEPTGGVSFIDGLDDEDED